MNEAILTQPETERGAVLVWMALMVVVLLGIAALAVDLGYAYSVKRQLSNTADAAALAGAQEGALKFLTVGGCMAPGEPLEALIRTAVYETHAANDPVGSTGNPDVDIDCTNAAGTPVTGLAATTVTVNVTETSELDTWFGVVLGVATLNPSATATANVTGTRFQTGLRPFLVCLDDAQAARDQFENASALKKSTWQSYYAKFIKSNPVTSTATFVGASWKKGTGVITTSEKVPPKPMLSVNQYVRLEFVNGTAGVTPGYYYVVGAPSTNNQDFLEFTVSTTRGGSVVAPSENFDLNVYTPTPVSGGGSTWNDATNVVNAAGHLLTNGSEVRVSIVAPLGQGGVSDGNYFVVNRTDTTFQLSDEQGGTPVDVTATLTIDVYPLSLAEASGTGCRPATSPANWGYSAFDLTNGDNPQLACLIKYGYGGDPDQPNGDRCLDVDGVPGFNVGEEATGIPADGDQGNNLTAADGELIQALIEDGNPILLPVGSGWNGGGGNTAEYDGRGALAVTLCGYVIPSNGNPDLGQAIGSYFSLDATLCPWYDDMGQPTTGQQMYGNAVASGKVTKDTSLVLQWRFSAYVGSSVGQPAEGADACPLKTCLGRLELSK